MHPTSVRLKAYRAFVAGQSKLCSWSELLIKILCTRKRLDSSDRRKIASAVIGLVQMSFMHRYGSRVHPSAGLLLDIAAKKKKKILKCQEIVDCVHKQYTRHSQSSEAHA